MEIHEDHMEWNNVNVQLLEQMRPKFRENKSMWFMSKDGKGVNSKTENENQTLYHATILNLEYFVLEINSLKYVYLAGNKVNIETER